MFSNTRMLRSVLVKAVLVAGLLVASAALADGGGSPTRPGGGYAEPVILNPIYLDGFGVGGTAYPMEMAGF